MRVLELYCGIGGAAAALAGRASAGRASAGRASVIAAVDIHRGALAVYRHNFDHPTHVATIESLDAARLERWDADLWWLSPPCQPFTRRGARRDDQDPRSRSLLALMSRIESVRPRFLALENVPGFEGSRTHAALLATLERVGYEVAEALCCPSQLGMPCRRRRYYLVAGREPLAHRAAPAGDRRALASFLDPADQLDPTLAVDPSMANAYRRAIDVVDRDDPAAVTACFTAAYGRSPVRSGSYLRDAGRLRRFSPKEIVRLLGFPEDYELPRDLPTARAWPLVGNSLAIPAVRWALSAVPGLA